MGTHPITAPNVRTAAAQRLHQHPQPQLAGAAAEVASRSADRSGRRAADTHRTAGGSSSRSRPLRRGRRGLTLLKVASKSTASSMAARRSRRRRGTAGPRDRSEASRARESPRGSPRRRSAPPPELRPGLAWWPTPRQCRRWTSAAAAACRQRCRTLWACRPRPSGQLRPRRHTPRLASAAEAHHAYPRGPLPSRRALAVEAASGASGEQRWRRGRSSPRRPPTPNAERQPAPPPPPAHTPPVACARLHPPPRHPDPRRLRQRRCR